MNGWSKSLDQFIPGKAPKEAPPEKKKPPRKEERVYFMREELDDGTLGRVKIGISNSPGYRRMKLQTGNSDKIIILGSIRGGRTEEERLHGMLAPWRKHGEWFYPSDEVLGLVNRVIEAGSLSGAEQSVYEKRFDMTSMLKKS